MKIYVDGSYKQSINPNVAGWAFAAFDENDVLLRTAHSVVENPASRQIDGELEATLEALRWVQATKERYFSDGGKIEIFHDYEGIGKWARNEWKTNTDLTKNYKESVNKLMLSLLTDDKKVETTFSWVKGHSKNAGNDLVDRLAGQAIVESVVNTKPKENSGKEQVLVEKEELEKILALLEYTAIIPNIITAKEHLSDLLKKFN